MLCVSIEPFFVTNEISLKENKNVFFLEKKTISLCTIILKYARKNVLISKENF